MSSPDPLPVPADLQASIEQLIASAVQGSHARYDDRLARVLRQTLADIESQQAALAAMADRIRTALDDDGTPDPVDAEPETDPAIDVPTPAAEHPEQAERDPHELDVIAHGTTLAQASGLQLLLRGMSEVADLQTRQFVNGELRLHATMAKAIDAPALRTWLDAHHGMITTFADDVIEIGFNDPV